MRHLVRHSWKTETWHNGICRRCKHILCKRPEKSYAWCGCVCKRTLITGPSVFCSVSSKQDWVTYWYCNHLMKKMQGWLFPLKIKGGVSNDLENTNKLVQVMTNTTCILSDQLLLYLSNNYQCVPKWITLVTILWLQTMAFQFKILYTLNQ